MDKEEREDRHADQPPVARDVAEFFEKLGLDKIEERQRLMALAQTPDEPQLSHWLDLGDTTSSTKIGVI